MARRKRQSSFRVSTFTLDALARLSETYGLTVAGALEFVVRDACKHHGYVFRDPSYRRVVDSNRTSSSPMPPTALRLTPSGHEYLREAAEGNDLTRSFALEIAVLFKASDEGVWTGGRVRPSRSEGATSAG